MASPLRQTDNRVEKEIAKFLDKNLYPTLPFNRFTRIVEKSEQLKGKDVVFSSEFLGISNGVIDEKCTAHYVNKNIPTFAFELSFLLDDNTEVNGWLIDENKETEYYLLLWPKAKVEDESATAPYFTSNDIEQIDYILVKRENIILFLHSKGFDKNRLASASRYYRDNVHDIQYQNQLKQKYKEKVGFYFMITRNLPETPVNVIIYRKDLEKIATLKGTCLP